MSSPQVALYKYEKTEWEKTNIEGTLFVYERKCEPTYGFLILNRLSATNLVQPVTKDIDLQDKSPFLLYKLKTDIHGIWFYEQANCKKLFNTISQVIDRIKKGNPGNKDNITSNPKMNNAVRSEGQTLADLLSNAGNKEKTHQEPKIKSSPSSGEKLLRLLSNQPGSKGEDSVAAFFAQASQSNANSVAVTSSAAGMLHHPPGLPLISAQVNPVQTVQPPMNALQNLLTTPGVVSVESLEGHQEMPPLPIQAQAASDLESNMKLPNKNNKNPQVNKKKETKADKAKITPNKQHVNGTSTAASYAAVAAATEQPQLMSPMVFASGLQNQALPGIIPTFEQMNLSPAPPPTTVISNGNTIGFTKKFSFENENRISIKKEKKLEIITELSLLDVTKNEDCMILTKMLEMVENKKKK